LAVDGCVVERGEGNVGRGEVVEEGR